MRQLSEQHIVTIKGASTKLTGFKRRVFQAQVAIDYLNSKPRLTESTFGWDRKTLHISAGKDNKTVVDFVEELEAKKGDRKAIKQVSCDMSPAFIKGVKENLPEAEITFDNNIL